MARSTQRDWNAFRRFTSRRTRPQQGTIRRPLERLLRGETLEDRRLLSVSLNLNGSQTITAGGTINVSSDATFGQSEMQIVVNPTNPLNLIGISHRLTNPITMEVYRSIDGGLTWPAASVTRFDGVNDDGLGTTTNRFDPAAVFDANGTLYIAYGVRGGAGPPATQTRLVAAASTDGGANFTNFRVIDQQNDPNGAGTPPPGLDKWYLASGVDPASGNQATYIAYVHFALEGPAGNVPDDRIMVAGTRDGGANWTAPININNPSITGANTGSSYASPVVGRLGELAISWHDSNTDTVFLDRDMDGLWAGGENFGADITVRTGVTVDRTVNLPPAQPERGINAAPMLAVWRNLGTLYMPVVEQFSGNDLDLKVGKSTDFGVTWNFTPLDSSSGTEFNPWLQVDQPSGAISVLYYTTDGDVGTGNDDVRVRLATSFDAGATWTKSFLSNQTSNEGSPLGYGGDYLEYIGLAAHQGTVHGLWASRYPGGGTDLDAFTANAGFVSSIGDNRLFIGESGGADDYFEIRQSAANPAFLEVFVDGVREFTGLSTTLDKIIINPGAGVNTFNIGTLTGISSITIGGTNDVDVFNLEALGSGTPLSMVLGGGGDVVSLAPNNPFAIGAINAPVTIFGDAGVDTLNVGSGGLHAVSGLVTYHGGGQGDALKLFDGANPFFVDYTISDSSVTRHDPFFFGGVNFTGVGAITLDATQGPNTVTLSATNLGSATVNGNGGNDNFIIGNGNNLGGGLGVFAGNGGEGLDTLTLNDSLSTHNGNWAILGAFTADPETVYLGLHAYDTEGFERVSVLAGNGNNPIQFQGTLTQDVTVHGGAGNDDFTFVRTSSFRDFFEEEDPPFHYEVTVDGGGDFNTLTVDDAAISIDRSYSITPSNVYVTELGPLGLDFDYDNFQSATFRAGPAPIFGGNAFHIFGTPADIPPGQQMRIFGGPVADHLTIYPRDAAGNLTINSNVTFQGNGAVDAILVDASASPLGINYQMAGGTLTGMGAGSVFIDGNEQLTFNAGNGSDTWTQISGPLFNPPTIINAGGGSNTFNLDASLSPNTWTINGGANLDTLNIIDSNNPSPSTSWTINASSVVRTRDDGLGFTKTFSHSAVDRVNVSATAGIDAFFVEAVASGTTLTLNGGAGLDGVGLAFATGNLDAIRGPVIFNGGPGGGNLHALDSADTTGDTVHQDQTSLGAYPGDNLFGPGGSLKFSDIVNFDVFAGVQVTLGSGADTVYAQPLPTGRVSIVANNPTTAPGDKLFLQLELAGAVNPVVSNPSAPNGNVTSSNRQTLSWTGIDQSAVVVVPGDFNVDGNVGASDLAVWRAAAGVSAAGDGDGDGDTDGADFLVWQRRLGSQSASPASESLAAVSPMEASRRQEIILPGLVPNPFPFGALDGSVKEQENATARRSDARAAVFSRQAQRWTGPRPGLATSFHNVGWRQGLTERPLFVVSGIEPGVDHTWRDVNDDDEMALRDLDFAFADYEQPLEAGL